MFLSIYISTLGDKGYRQMSPSYEPHLLQDHDFDNPESATREIDY